MFTDGDGAFQFLWDQPATFSKLATVHYTVKVGSSHPILHDASDSIEEVGILVLSDAKCKKGSPKGLD